MKLFRRLPGKVTEFVVLVQGFPFSKYRSLNINIPKQVCDGPSKYQALSRQNITKESPRVFQRMDCLASKEKRQPNIVSRLEYLEKLVFEIKRVKFEL